MAKKVESQGRWSYQAGEYGHTVSVYEREPGGVIYASIWDPAIGKDGQARRRSLKHRSRRRAIAWAKEQAEKLRDGRERRDEGRVTLGEVFRLYALKRTPRKSASEQTADARRVEMWSSVLGADRDPHGISLDAWEGFVDARMAGAIDARGRPRKKPTPVSARTVEADCLWLKWVFNWAARWRLRDSGRYLMQENPVRGYDAPSEKNPRRPVASQDRLEALLEAAGRHTMTVTRAGSRVEVRSYLRELLTIVNGTGRRISAVCQLRYADLRLDDVTCGSTKSPHGAIHWPAATDKQGVEATVPLSPDVRRALDRIRRERPGIGDAPLFPAPEDPAVPMSRYRADRWLRAAEELAGLDPQDGSLWHAFRRKWATERKHLPDVDVPKTGGWKSLEALRECYTQPDADTMLKVVLGAGQLREQA